MTDPTPEPDPNRFQLVFEASAEVTPGPGRPDEDGETQ
jgi:hypothetical protein